MQQAGNLHPVQNSLSAVTRVQRAPHGQPRPPPCKPRGAGPRGGGAARRAVPAAGGGDSAPRRGGLGARRNRGLHPGRHPPGVHRRAARAPSGMGSHTGKACVCARAEVRRARRPADARRRGVLAPAGAGASAQSARACTCGTLAPFVLKVRREARLRRRDVPAHAGGGQGGRAARARARVLPAGGLARRGVAALAAGPLPGGAGGRGPGQPAGHRGRGAVRRRARRHLPRQADVRAVAAGARPARPGPPVPARVRARASR